MPDATAYSLDRKILYVGLRNGKICQIAMNSNGILTRLSESKLGIISKFINFDAIVPFKTRFELEKEYKPEYLLTIRSYLAPNGSPKAMLNIFDVDSDVMISNENNLVTKNNISLPEVNDACLIESGIEEFSLMQVFALATKKGISFVTYEMIKDSGASKFEVLVIGTELVEYIAVRGISPGYVAGCTASGHLTIHHIES